tara:strand:- start:2003 stop:2341 length:339 start_codon:yes stop_codon:yes gene_type:complete
MAANSHDLVPTYPEIKESHVTGIYQAKLSTWNKREEVEYYEIGVFDEDFKPVRFATIEKIVRIKYLSKKKFAVYIKEVDLDRAVYICTTSKTKKENITRAIVSSRVCSKIKR